MITYDAEDDPFNVCELAVATYDAPAQHLNFMCWAVYVLRRVDPRSLFHVKFQYGR